MLVASKRLFSQRLNTRLRSVAKMSSFYDLSAEKLDGKTGSFSDYKGKVVLVVNTATLWGTTVRDFTQVFLWEFSYFHDVALYWSISVHAKFTILEGKSQVSDNLALLPQNTEHAMLSGVLLESLLKFQQQSIGSNLDIIIISFIILYKIIPCYII